MAINLYISIGGGTLLSNGNYQVTKGDSIEFSVTAIGGVTPYTYTWDFGDRSQGDVLGDWDLNGSLISYASGQNSSHIFNEYGVYDVTLYVRDSEGTSAYSYISVYVPVGGTVLDPTIDCGVNNIVGDGVTDNTNKLAAAVTAVGSAVTFTVPSGTYLFSVQNIFPYTTEIKPKDGSLVTFLFDPIETAELILHLDNNVTDSSVTTPHTVTNNNVTFDADDKITGTHSAVFNGTNAFLSIPDDPDFDLSATEFAILHWIKLTDLTAIYPIYYQQTDVDNYCKLYIDTDGSVGFSINGVDVAKTSAGLITANVWCKVQLQTEGTGAYYGMYINHALALRIAKETSPANYTGNVQIGYDGSVYFKGKIDEVILEKDLDNIIFLQNAVLRNLTLTRVVNSNENYTALRRTLFAYNWIILQNCTLQYFTQQIDNGSDTSEIKTNFIDWGGSTFRRQSCFTGVANSMFCRDCYFKATYTTGLIVYAGNMTIGYWIRNHMDHSTADGPAGTNTFQLPNIPAFFYKNYIQGYLSSFGTLSNEDLHVIQNNIVGAGLYLSLSSAINAKINNNSMFNTGPTNHAVQFVGGNINVQVQNNTFGAGCIAGDARLNWFNPLGGQICGENGPVLEGGTFDPNPGIVGDDPDYTGAGIYCATWGGNVSNPAYENPISDPGQWEFVPPTISSISLAGNTLTIDASDSGSGLGSTPRWPLPNASMVQVRYADGTLSEIQAYAAETTWSKKPHKFRICDGHQNWTNEAATCPQIQVGTGASINAGSGGSLVLG